MPLRFRRKIAVQGVIDAVGAKIEAFVLETANLFGGHIRLFAAEKRGKIQFEFGGEAVQQRGFMVF